MKNKLKRLIVYKNLLKDVCNDPSVDYGFCHYLKGINIRDLEELYRFKPKTPNRSYPFWFPTTTKGWEKRIDILEKVIKSVETSILIDDLIKFRNFFKKSKFGGFCIAIEYFYVDDYSKRKIYNFLFENKPKKTFGTYWFKPYEKKSRINFLNDLISKLKKETLKIIKTLVSFDI